MKDTTGFRAFLEARKATGEQIDAALSLVAEFEAFLGARGLDAATPEDVWAFSRRLIQEGCNTLDNYYALARCGRFIQNNAMFVAVLDLLDGEEAHANLHRKAGEAFGEALRDEAFAGVGVAPLGTPSPEKPRFMHTVLRRLEGRVGEAECARLLADSLRDLPDEYFQDAPKMFRESRDIDDYLARRKQGFLGELEACQREGRLFFAQEVTDEVIAFVRADPEMGGGRREGNVIYEVKIPYLTREHLAEADPVLKRYYYCHCPWAREAIRGGDVTPAATFCNCSGGFHKKPWTMIFGPAVCAEVLESVLRGDTRCRFAIHLPAEAFSADPQRPQA
jgi:hypothetical protein